jgi:hypothetical protein
MAQTSVMAMSAFGSTAPKNKIKQNNIFGSEVLTPVTMQSVVVWILTPCSSERTGRFGATFHLPFQAGKQKEAIKLSACFLLVFLFEPEVGEDMLFRNVELSPNLKLKILSSLK